jgi:L-seryl-tRNA(Ser) seleniumtransferase
VEVGTTNRTYVRDYEDAVTSETAAFLRVHSSNFRVIGFTHEPALAELAAAAHARGLLMLDDLGSGCLLDTARFGLAPEPMVQASLAAGVDLATFSGDKLLGGPQAGIMVGRTDLVEQTRRHPLARALRLDKASIAALAATLGHYTRGEALREVPVWRMIAAPVDGLERRARAWTGTLDGATVIEGRSMIGGGSLPEESLSTRLLAVHRPRPDQLARALRAGDPAVVARVEHDLLLLDPRTVDPEDDGLVATALQNLT